MPWNFTLERWIGACREPWRPEMKYWMGAPAAPAAAEQRRDESHVRGGGQSERACRRAGSQTRRRARTRRRRVPWPPAFLAWSAHRSAHSRLLPTKMSPGDHTCVRARELVRVCACARTCAKKRVLSSKWSCERLRHAIAILVLRPVCVSATLAKLPKS